MEITDVLREAADLMDHDHINEEYNRALIELTCRLLGVMTDECRESVQTLIEAHIR